MTQESQHLTTTDPDLIKIRKRQARIQKARLARRKKLYTIRIIACLLVLCSIVIGVGVYKLLTIQPDTSSEIATESSSEPLALEVPEPEIQEPETMEDVRTVQNTATAEHHKTNGLAICMYHYVYDANNIPDDLNSNYIEQNALREEFQYLLDNDYFFPTWEEVYQYINGDLDSPEKSVVLTFDDAHPSFLELGIPIAKEMGVPITSFVITAWGGPDIVTNYATPYVTFQSHSHDMHKAGGNIGHGGIFTALSVADGVADLTTSIEICGNGEAFAYPFGDYSDSCVQALQETGFLCAVTTEPGRVFPGDNPLLLPRVRMSEGQSLSSFISRVE